MIQADSSIVKITQNGREPVDVMKYNFESSDEENSNEKNNSKMFSHQTDKYSTKKLRRNFFQEDDDQSIDTNVISTPMKNTSGTKSKELSKQEVQYYSKQVRMGKKIDLPNMSKLKKADQLDEKQNRVQNANVPQKLLNNQSIKWKVTKYKPTEISNFRTFIKATIPRYKTLNTILHRNRGGLKRFFPLFDVQFAEEPEYIMSSKRISCNATSNFFITSNSSKLNENDREFMGHVQSNFSGSVYNLYDEQPTDREILATIAYESTLRLSEEPRNIEVYITHPEHKYYLLDGIDGKKNLKELYEIGDNASARKILKFINKKPRWNKQKKCFQMDFHGKMKIPSVKNMILVDAESQKEEVLLLGKIEDHAFNMDVNYPLSPRIALAIANSSFDFKWVSQ